VSLLSKGRFPFAVGLAPFKKSLLSNNDLDIARVCKIALVKKLLLWFLNKYLSTLALKS
jgi:hypothetical protein